MQGERTTCKGTAMLMMPMFFPRRRADEPPPPPVVQAIILIVFLVAAGFLAAFIIGAFNEHRGEKWLKVTPVRAIEKIIPN
jgi:hypothetical protein